MLPLSLSPNAKAKSDEDAHNNQNLVAPRDDLSVARLKVYCKKAVLVR